MAGDVDIETVISGSAEAVELSADVALAAPVVELTIVLVLGWSHPSAAIAGPRSPSQRQVLVTSSPVQWTWSSTTAWTQTWLAAASASGFTVAITLLWRVERAGRTPRPPDALAQGRRTETARPRVAFPSLTEVR